METVALTIDALDAVTMYAVCRLRQDVFVIEQDCLYPDLDGRDTEPGTVHVVLREDAGSGEVVGYARLLDEGPEWRIGRVVLAPSARGRGLADEVLRTALAAATERDGSRDVVLGAQSPLARWYATHGFAVDGEEYLEDGIPHTPMRLSRG